LSGLIRHRSQDYFNTDRAVPLAWDMLAENFIRSRSVIDICRMNDLCRTLSSADRELRLITPVDVGKRRHRRSAMRRVKRTAISLKPKQAYGVKIDTEFTPDESIYLIDVRVDQPNDLEKLLAPHYKAIIEEELGAWHRIEGD
jgi:hypothetical protein